MTRSNSIVAQTSGLPYRRFAVGWVLNSFEAFDTDGGLVGRDAPRAPRLLTLAAPLVLPCLGARGATRPTLNSTMNANVLPVCNRQVSSRPKCQLQTGSTFMASRSFHL